jgi:hypothetical protein
MPSTTASRPISTPPSAGNAPLGQLSAHPGRAIGAVRDLVDLGDGPGQLGVGALPGARLSFAGLVIGGFGDLEQLAGTGDPALLRLFRLEEGTGLHRVS